MNKYIFRHDRHEIEEIRYSPETRELSVKYSGVDNARVHLNVPDIIYHGLNLDDTEFAESAAYEFISNEVSPYYSIKNDTGQLIAERIPTVAAQSDANPDFGSQFSGWMKKELTRLNIQTNSHCAGRKCWINVSASYGGGAFLSTNINGRRIRVNNDTHLCAIHECLSGTPECVISARGREKIGLNGSTVANLQIYVD